MIMLCSILILTSCGPKYQEGSYEGEGKGYSPDKNIKLNISIDENGKISDINIVDHDENEEIGAVALERLKKLVLENGNGEVDTITAATMTSDGFRAALNEALRNAEK